MLPTSIFKKLFHVKFIFVNDKEYLLALNYLLNAAFDLSKLMDIVSTDSLRWHRLPQVSSDTI